MTRLFRPAWDAIRHLVGARVSATSVRRILLEQAGVAAVDLVRLVPAAADRRQLLVRVRIAEGCDAREVSRDAAEALCRDLSVTEIRIVATSSAPGP